MTEIEDEDTRDAITPDDLQRLTAFRRAAADISDSTFLQTPPALNFGISARLNTVNLGLNYLLKGHAANFKLDYAINDRRVSDSNADTFRFQSQLMF